MRDAILACLRCSVTPLTTPEVAYRIGQRREKVRTEMLLMHNAGLVVQVGWCEFEGRRRPTFTAKEVK